MCCMKLKCKMCNAEINEGEEYKYYITDEPVCKDCMKGGNGHSHCPNCDKLIPDEHMSGSFCDICTSEAEQKDNWS